MGNIWKYLIVLWKLVISAGENIYFHYIPDILGIKSSTILKQCLIDIKNSSISLFEVTALSTQVTLNNNLTFTLFIIWRIWQKWNIQSWSNHLQLSIVFLIPSSSVSVEGLHFVTSYTLAQKRKLICLTFEISTGLKVPFKMSATWLQTATNKCDLIKFLTFEGVQGVKKKREHIFRVSDFSSTVEPLSF